MEAVEVSRFINTLLCDIGQSGLSFPTCGMSILDSAQELDEGMKACPSPALGSSMNHRWEVCAWERFQTHQQLWANPEHPLHFVTFSIALGWWEAERGRFRWDGGRARLTALTSPSLPWKVTVMSSVWAIYLADSPFCQRFMPGHQNWSCCGNNSPSKLQSPFCTGSLR